MKSINEKLAELCGYPYTTNDLGGFVERATCKWIVWNPTADLNQLKMCYEALTPSEQVDFWQDSRRQGIEVQTVFTDTELVAQAILKAKGVS